MAEKKYTVPEILAILPVRDTVLFPGAVLPLTVGRESSLALVNSLEGEEKLLGVVAQLDPRIEDPAAADLHKVGTLAKVHKTVKMPNGNVVIFLEGLQRVNVLELIGLRPFLRARVESQPEITGDVDAELEALQRNAQDLFRDVVSHSPQLSDDLQSVAMNIDDPGRLADFIAGTLPSLSTLLRQELIETPSVRKRLEMLIRELSKELEVLELRSKIHEQVQEQVGQNQREYLLREQMKAIQKELGESDDSGQEIDELRKKVDEAGMTAEARKECDREHDAGFGGVHGFANLSGVDDVIAVGKVFRRERDRHRQGKADSGRRPLRPGEGEGTDSRLPGGEEIAAGDEGADPVLRWASWRGQDFTGKIYRAVARPQIRAHRFGRHAR
jgi:ATP-dependent Lon protease